MGLQCESSCVWLIDVAYVHHQVDFVCRTANAKGRLNKNSCGEVIIEVTLYCCWHFDNPKWRSQDLIGKKFEIYFEKNFRYHFFFKTIIQLFWMEKKKDLQTLLQIKYYYYSLKYFIELYALLYGSFWPFFRYNSFV